MRNLFYAALAAMATFVVAAPANAATYTVDSALSKITLNEVTAGGITFFGQSGISDSNFPGMRAFYQGTVEATVSGDFANPTIIFGGGSFIDALLNINAPGGEYLPAQGGSVPGLSNDPNLGGGDFIFADGSVDPNGEGDGLFSVGEDNYGLSNYASPNNGPIKSSIRNFVVDFTGGGIANDATDDGLALNIVDGWYAIDLAGRGGENFISEEQIELSALQFGIPNIGDVGYSLVGHLETITIPVDIGYQVEGAINITAKGTIVAMRTMPEPTSGLFLASLATGAGAVVRRRRK